MKPLEETVFSLENQQLAVGKTLTRTEFLKLWVYRREDRYDLYVTSTLEAVHRGRQPYRNVVGKELESPEEVLEAIASLDSIYKVEAQLLLRMPSAVRQAEPQMIYLLDQQLSRWPQTTTA